MGASTDRRFGTGTLVCTSGLAEPVFGLFQFMLYRTESPLSTGFRRRTFIFRLWTADLDFPGVSTTKAVWTLFLGTFEECAIRGQIWSTIRTRISRRAAKFSFAVKPIRTPVLVDTFHRYSIAVSQSAKFAHITAFVIFTMNVDSKGREW